MAAHCGWWLLQIGRDGEGSTWQVHSDPAGGLTSPVEAIGRSQESLRALPLASISTTRGLIPSSCCFSVVACTGYGLTGPPSLDIHMRRQPSGVQPIDHCVWIDQEDVPKPLKLIRLMSKK